MNILGGGATGGLGGDIVTDTLARRHACAALVRDAARATLPSEVELATGDVLDLVSLCPAVAGREAVICALGTPSPRKPSTLLRDGTENLIAAMTEQGVRRLVCVTLLRTGASRSQCSLVYRELILRVLAPMLPTKRLRSGWSPGATATGFWSARPDSRAAGPAAMFECWERASRGDSAMSSAPTSPASSSTVPPAPSTPAKRCRSGPDARA